MNLLQSFMGCMYPGSIRTESIDSIDNEYPDCRYQVANIDNDGATVSEGELQLTDRDLIYFRPSRFPTNWPLSYIRRYGYSEEKQAFVFEAGRKCDTGPAIFAFRLSRGAELAQRLHEKLEKANEDIKNNPDCRVNHPNSHGSRAHMRSNRPNQVNQRSENQPSILSVPRISPANEKRDACTSTDNATIDSDQTSGLDPRPLSYALIDFGITKALNDTAQAHAASRVR